MEPRDIVRLKGTEAIYRIRALYCTYPLSPSLSEEWAVLVKGDGSLAYWPVILLELVKKFE